MFWINLKIALRNLRKNKIFTCINIAGLALGLSLYIFGNLFVEYESTFDSFFAKSDQIYTIGQAGFWGGPITVPALAPVIAAQIPDIQVARLSQANQVVSIGNEQYFDGITYADPSIVEIFDFDYLYGDSSTLDDPSSLIITKASALKYFGRTDVIGEAINLDHQFEFSIGAVIEDFPLNTHFHTVSAAKLKMIGSIENVTRNLASQWNWISSDGDFTYVLLPEYMDSAFLQKQLEPIYQNSVPDDMKEYFEGFQVSPIARANLILWDRYGFSITIIVPFLSLLILLIACVNYANLAIAQSLARTREVGLRKTLGANKNQLLTQFLTESTVVATIAMALAITLLELAIPVLNNFANKDLQLDYSNMLPSLIVLTLLVGLCAGSYPAWLITRNKPINALKDQRNGGAKDIGVRTLLIGAQFAISAFMLAVVTVVLVQNEKIERDSYVFPRSEIYTLDLRLRDRNLWRLMDDFQAEISTLANVEAVGLSSQLPYQGGNRILEASARPGDQAGKFKANQLLISPEFFEVYDIPLLAGRNLDLDFSNDLLRYDEGALISERANVIVDELVLSQLGIETPQEAINRVVYDMDEGHVLKEYVIVGVVPTRNINGISNNALPWVYLMNNIPNRASVRISGENIFQSVKDIEVIWKRIFPGYPMRGQFLDTVFEDNYRIFRLASQTLSALAFVALSLALAGLFGLAAHITAKRTREIGIRKVLGANAAQVTRLLAFQISAPIACALLIALPAAYFASNRYLEIFPEQINSQLIIIVLAGIASVILGWITVAGCTFWAARAKPIHALRHE